MSYSLIAADRSTHVRVIAVALAGSVGFAMLAGAVSQEPEPIGARATFTGRSSPAVTVPRAAPTGPVGTAKKMRRDVGSGGPATS